MRKKPSAPADPVPDATPATPTRAKPRGRDRGPSGVSEPPAVRASTTPKRAAPKAAKRQTLSAKGRLAIAERMKQYWAKRRKKQKPR